MIGDSLWPALRTSPGRFLRSRWPWQSVAYLLGSVVVAPIVWVAMLFPPAFVLLAVPVGALERRRLAFFEAVPAPSPHTSAPDGGRAWLRHRLRETATWRELAYALCLGTVVFLIDMVGLFALALGGLLLLLPVFVAVGDPVQADVRLGTLVVDTLGEAVLVAGAVGVPVVLIASYALSALAGAQAAFTRWLLAPTPVELARQLADLTTSRARLVNAFEAERRRIERDLHDGAQQHLVMLSISLGLAELENGDENPRLGELLSQAHGQARNALTAMREQIHGIHPRVLSDYGLPAAVAELADRCRMPVVVDLTLNRRLPPAVESTAYFVVCEAVANAVRHAGCSRIEVTGSLEDDVLRLSVVDDGTGGADPAAGTGLRGLADRAAVMAGTLVLASPLGGPTALRLELPCHCA